MDPVKFVENSFQRILFGPFWNSLRHMITDFQILTPMDLNPRILFSTLMICDFDNGMILFIYFFFWKNYTLQIITNEFFKPGQIIR